MKQTIPPQWKKTIIAYAIIIAYAMHTTLVC